MYVCVWPPFRGGEAAKQANSKEESKVAIESEPFRNTGVSGCCAKIRNQRPPCYVSHKKVFLSVQFTEPLAA